MQKWEYLEIHYYGEKFSVISQKGQHFGDEYYKSIDPNGKKGSKYQWETESTTMFLITILNELGNDGWELVGNVLGGTFNDSLLILKRLRDSN